MLDKPHEPIHKMLPCFVPIPKEKRQRKITNRKNPPRKGAIPIIVISSQFIGKANPVQIYGTSPLLFTGCCIPSVLNLKEPEAER